jgi:hypothetical protein
MSNDEEQRTVRLVRRCAERHVPGLGTCVFTAPSVAIDMQRATTAQASLMSALSSTSSSQLSLRRRSSRRRSTRFQSERGRLPGSRSLTPPVATVPTDASPAPV